MPSNFMQEINQKILEIPFLFFFTEMLCLLGRELFMKTCRNDDEVLDIQFLRNILLILGKEEVNISIE
jgi:hypothetical protein